MYSHLFVAIDGSPVGGAALQHAIELAREQHARLHVAHVMDMLGMTWATDEILESQRQFGQGLLDQACANARKLGVQSESSLLHTAVVGQRPAEVLAEQARAVAADLVVLGSHGRRGMSHLFLGSVAEGVARLCPMPVLIVHGPAGG
ncbi:MAG: universal stress protein [Proteobacteria bacterium]|nr:universal stress protein [Pseudomonadota bacterium]